MRSQMRVVWLDDERGSVKKDGLWRRRFGISANSAMNVCVENAAPLSFRKTAGTSGFHVPCSSPPFVSHLVRNIVKHVGPDLVRTLHGACKLALNWIGTGDA